MQEIQPRQQLNRAPPSLGSGPAAGRKALTLQGRASIRPAMAAGAILPPMFFERHRFVSLPVPSMAFSQNTRK
jgi:hypothetical protein